MRKIFTLLIAGSLSAAAFAAHAGEDSTERYGLQPPGPAWWESPCGLPCFAAWRQSCLDEGDIAPQQLARVRTVAEMQTLIADATQGDQSTAFGATRGRERYRAGASR